jgi:hypothetical protein
MRLGAGESTGEHAEAHEDSEQLLLLLVKLGFKETAFDFVCELIE